jgi:5'-methylthioadenosine phosphorylase
MGFHHLHHLYHLYHLHHPRNGMLGSMRIDAAIIGGTGIGSRLLDIPGKVVHVPTQYGFLRGRLLDIEGKSVLAMSRHSAGHKVPPHKVDYKAMAAAVKSLGARACFSTAAVGSLRPEWGCGTLVACSDFIDLTGRFPTLYDRAVVHTDFSEPFSARGHLLGAGEKVGVDIKDGGVYVCGNGPRYETPEEIGLYRQFGGDIVGMTAASEAILMREAGVPYGCLAIVTNLACGITDMPLNHEEVVDEMNRSGEVALRILSQAVATV